MLRKSLFVGSSRATNETDCLIVSALITEISCRDQSCFIMHSTPHKECAVTFDIILLVITLQGIKQNVFAMKKRKIY